jgi:putative transposase
VSEIPNPHNPGPPHNPGVQRLVSRKRQTPLQLQIQNATHGYRGWHERGYLPHRDEPGLTQFVTFHLADTFPKSLRSEWEHLWLLEENRERRLKLEDYLDRGRGECHLRNVEIAKLVEDNFVTFSGCFGAQSDGESQVLPRYELLSWCVMPNHVHVLFKVGSTSMSEIVGAWKKHTGRLANQLLGKNGAFWSRDYFDVYIRDSNHELKARRYIENNPAKAKLVAFPELWPWSSARFRDKAGLLKFPRRGATL